VISTRNREFKWHFRTQPLPDELLSSWLVRYSTGMIMKLQAFTTHNLGQQPQFWTNDVDRTINTSLCSILGNASGIAPDECKNTTLEAFAHALWPEFHKGSPNWLLPVGKYGRYRKLYGLQYCRLCLAEDENPYFRKSWRLGFNTCCLSHGIYLQDACPSCHSPIQFHTTDFGRTFLSRESRITICSFCQHDIRYSLNEVDITAAAETMSIQSWMTSLLSDGFGTIDGYNIQSSVLLFHGLHCLLRPFTSKTRLARIKSAANAHYGELDLASINHVSKFEFRRVGDRALCLKGLYFLLQDWPLRFIELCRKQKISSSYLQDFHKPLPYWLAKEIYWHLFDKDYQPTYQERNSARLFLETRGYPVNESNINLLVGGSAVSARARLIRERWNPRGPSSNQHLFQNLDEDYSTIFPNT